MSKIHNGMTVRSFLKVFVEQGSTYTVDDQSYVIQKVNGEKLPLTQESGEPKYMTIYDPGQMNTDVIIFNPFAEGVELTADKTWFYQTQNLILAGTLFRIIEGIMKEVVAIKAGASESNAANAKLLAPFMNEAIDEKMLTELGSIGKDYRNFMNVFYSARNRHQTINVGVFEENFVKAFGNTVRKKTWPVLRKIITTILGTDNPKEAYVTKSTVPACPRFSSYAHIYTRILKTYAPYLGFQTREFDIEGMEEHLPRLAEYQTTAQFLRTNAPTVKSTTAGALQVSPWGQTAPGFGGTTPNFTTPTMFGGPTAPMLNTGAPAVLPGVVTNVPTIAAVGTPTTETTTTNDQALGNNPLLGPEPHVPAVSTPVSTVTTTIPVAVPGGAAAQAPFQPMAPVVDGSGSMPVPMMSPGIPMVPAMPMMPVAPSFSAPAAAVPYAMAPMTGFAAAGMVPANGGFGGPNMVPVGTMPAQVGYGTVPYYQAGGYPTHGMQMMQMPQQGPMVRSNNPLLN